MTTMDEIVAQVTRQYEALGAASVSLAHDTHRATSPCGTVAAEVSLSGRLVGLTLGRAISAASGRSASRLIRATARHAAELADADRQRILAELRDTLTPPGTSPAGEHARTTSKTTD